MTRQQASSTKPAKRKTSNRLQVHAAILSLDGVTPFGSIGIVSFVIVTFQPDETKLILDSFQSRHYPPDIQKVALRKLLLIEAATSINDLRVPPGNRLEKLVGDREGQYSIHINHQCRICFVWTDENNADRVEIVDYH